MNAEDFVVNNGDAKIHDSNVGSIKRGFHNWQYFVNLPSNSKSNDFYLNSSFGNFIFKRTEFEFQDYSFPFKFELYYNSGTDFKSSLSYGWKHNFEIRYVKNNFNRNIIIVLPDDKNILFEFNKETESYKSNYGITDSLFKIGNNKFKLILYNDDYFNNGNYSEYYFEDDNHNYITKIIDLNKNSILFDYDNNKNLKKVIFPTSRVLNFNYSSNKLISVDFEGFNTIYFNYSKDNLLSKIVSNLNTNEFNYDEECFKLIKIIENSTMKTNLKYDNLFRLNQYVLADSVIEVDVNYSESSTNIELNHKKYCEIKYDSDFKYIQINDLWNNSEFVKWNNRYQIIEKIDRNGNLTKFQYGDLGKIKNIIDAENNTKSFVYDDKIKKLKTILYNQVSIYDYDYDDFGNLVKVKNFADIFELNYDINGLLTEINQSDRNLKLMHDLFGNISSLKFSDQSKYFFECDRYSNYTSTIDANNNKYSFIYNYNNDIQLLNYPDNSSKKFIYNDLGNLSTIVYPDNSDIKFKYDNLGRKIAVINQLNFELKFSYLKFDSITISYDDLFLCNLNYHANSLLNSLTYYNSMEYKIDYDKNYNIKSLKNLDNSRFDYEYDMLNRLVSISDVNNRFLRFSYFYPNYLKSITKPNNEIINFFYNANNLSSISQSLNYNFKFEYDIYGNLTKITDPNLNQFNYSYNLFGLMTSMILPDNSSKFFEYDLNGNLKTETLRNNNLITYNYNSRNLISNKIDINGYTLNYLYNSNKRIIKSVDNFDRQTTYSYDKAGNIISFQSSNNLNYRFEYNKFNILSNFIINNQKFFKFESDIFGNIISITYPNEAIFEYQYINNNLSSIGNKQAEIKILYDRINRPTNLIDAYNKILSFQYDNAGLINKIILPNLANYDLNFNGLGSLVNIKKPEGNIFSYFYDNYQNLIRYFIDEKLIANLNYDKNNKLNRIITSEQDTAEYKYNNYGLISNFKDLNSLSTTYEYNNNNNLIRVDNGIVKLIDYNEFNLPSYISIEGIPRINLDYEKFGKLKTISFADIKFDFLYDSFNNIIKVKFNNQDFYTFILNSSNQPIEIIDRYGLKLKYKFDNFGNLTTITNSENKSISYQYNLMGKPEIYFDYKERPSRYTFNSNGLISSFTNREQIQTDYFYNRNDMLSVIKFNRTDSIKIQYNSANFIKSITYPNDNQYTYEFDKMGRILQIQSDNYEISRVVYSLNNNSFAFISPENDTSTYLFDKYGRISNVKKNHNFHKIFKYNSIGSLLEEMNGKYLLRKNIYDSNQRIIHNFRTDSNLYQYNYNVNSEISKLNVNNFYFDVHKFNRNITLLNNYDTIVYNISLTNNINSVIKNNNKLNFIFDDDFGLISLQKATNTLHQINTDNEGRIISFLLPNKNNYSFNYDGRNNIRKITHPNSNSFNFSFDRNSNLILFENENQDKFNYNFDLNNKITSFTGLLDKKRNFKYDKNWNTTNIIENHTLISRIESIYDFDNRIEDLSIYFSNFSKRSVKFNYEANKLKTIKFNDIDSIKYIYDSLDNFEFVIGYQKDTIAIINSHDSLIKTINFPNGFKQVSHYNLKGLVKNFKLLSNDNNSIIDISYQYNTFDNINKITFNNDSIINYEYNDLQQISKVIQGIDTIFYFYDEIGNLNKKINNNQIIELNYSNDNKLMNFGDIDFTWDNKGNAISRSDAESVVQFYYDDENRLTQAIYNDTLKLNFYYSGKNNLIRISVNNDEYFLPIDYEKNSKFNAILEFDKNLNLSKRYVYSPNKDRFDLLYYYDIAKNQTNYIHSDPYSFFIFKSEMNNNYQLLNSFDLFGNPNFQSENSLRVGFNGMTFIKELNLYFIDGRFFDPKTGIFLQKDKNLFESSNNLYRFKNNNILNEKANHRNNYELFVDASKTQQTLNPFDNKYLSLNSKEIVCDLLDTLFNRQFNLFKNFNLNYYYYAFEYSKIIDEYFEPKKILNVFQKNILDEFSNFNRLKFYPKLPKELLIEELQDKFNSNILEDIGTPLISKNNKIKKVIDILKLTDLPKNNAHISFLEKVNNLIQIQENIFSNIIEIKLPEPDLKLINSTLQSGNNFNKVLQYNYLNNKENINNPLHFLKSIFDNLNNKFFKNDETQIDILKPYIQNYSPKIDLLNNFDFPDYYNHIISVENSNFFRNIDLLNKALDNSVNVSKILYSEPKIIIPYSFNFINNLGNFPIAPKFYNLEINQIKPPIFQD